MKLARGTILPILALTLIGVAVSASLYYSWRITSRIRVEYPEPEPPPSPPKPTPTPTVKIGVYTGSDCAVSVTEIDWGTLMPGDAAKRSVYIRNEGNVPVVLYLNVENWNPPEASSYMALDWNYIGAQIPVTTGISTEFQLTIFSNCTSITNFSFDIVITAEGQT